MKINTRTRLISLLAAVCLALGCLAGCQPADTTEPTGSTPTQPAEFVDYGSQLTLDMDSESLKLEVTVKTYVDGDTTHFYTDDPSFAGGVFKARYLAVNTPESTGKIEEYGKAASAFTRAALENATSIIIESDDEKWNADSTGGRYMVWVWYKTAEMTQYRNLNLDILQNGLAIASNTGNNRYGSICLKALNQAKAHKLKLFSGEKDPDFYYGEAQELTLKELRLNTEAYNNQKVAFTGIISLNDGNQGVFVESYDEETGRYYGMSIYYGFNLSGAGLEILGVGNEVRIVGTVQYYEAGGTWQVSGLTYRQMVPNDPGNIQKISGGNEAAWVPVTGEDLHSKVTVVTEEGEKSYPYAQLALSTTVSLDGLYVEDVYTTDKEQSSSKGAMTLTCKTADGKTVDVRTVVLYDEQGELLTQEDFLGKTISVKGVVDFYDGDYQVKVFSTNHIIYQ